FVFQEMASWMESSQLRSITRRVIKVLHADLNLLELCKTLLEERPEIMDQNEEIRQKWIFNISDIISVICVTHAALQKRENEKEYTFLLSQIMMYVLFPYWVISIFRVKYLPSISSNLFPYYQHYF